ELDLRRRETLLGGAAIPEHRLLVAALEAHTVRVGEGQTLLSRRESLDRRLAPPLHGRAVVLPNARAGIVRIAQTRLRGGDAVLGGARPPDDRLRIVVRDTAALAEHAAETLLCERVTGLRGFAIPPRGLREVLIDPGAAIVERGQERLHRRIDATGERHDGTEGRVD